MGSGPHLIRELTGAATAAAVAPKTSIRVQSVVLRLASQQFHLARTMQRECRSGSASNRTFALFTKNSTKSQSKAKSVHLGSDVIQAERQMDYGLFGNCVCVWVILYGKVCLLINIIESIELFSWLLYALFSFFFIYEKWTLTDTMYINLGSL